MPIPVAPINTAINLDCMIEIIIWNTWTPPKIEVPLNTSP